MSVLTNAPEHAQASSGPGRILAEERRARRLDLAEVAQNLKFAPRQIEALEADDYARLPGTTIVRGMIRSYARLLEIDPQPLLRLLEERYAPPPPSVETGGIKPVPFPDGRRRSTRLYLAASALAFGVVLGVLYEWHSGGSAWRPASDATPPAAPAASAPQVASAVAPGPENPAPPAAAPAVKPDAAPGPASVAEASAAREAAGKAPAAAAPASVRGASGLDARIRMEFKDNAWVEIRDKGGHMLMYQLNPAGTEKTIEGKPPFQVVIGNASAVRLSYKDEPVDLAPHVRTEVARLTLD